MGGWVGGWVEKRGEKRWVGGRRYLEGGRVLVGLHFLNGGKALQHPKIAAVFPVLVHGEGGEKTKSLGLGGWVGGRVRGRERR